jgi:proteasome lid subunit RPN8/RPN11
MIRLPRPIYDAILKQARSQMPDEACGYLAGKNGVVEKHFELTNTDHSPEHFTMDPKEQFQAIREARTLGLEMIAVYHSHPETPARPSEEDIRLAFDSSIYYVIVSLKDDSGDIKAFKIRDRQVEKHGIEIDS